MQEQWEDRKRQEEKVPLPEITARHDRRQRDVDRTCDQVERQMAELAKERVDQACHILNRVREMTADHLPDGAFIALIQAVKIFAMDASDVTLSRVSDEIQGIF